MWHRTIRSAATAAAVLSMASLSPRAMAQNAAVTVNVDVTANRHAINPNIYGISAGTPAVLKDLNIPLNRYGGNNATRYNWKLNADNRGSDWFFESIADTSAVPGERGDSFIANNRSVGAEGMLTIPTIGWVANLPANRTKMASFRVSKYGAQTGVDSWWSDAGNGVSKSTGKNITGNDPNDANVPSNPAFQAGWVQHIVGKFGKADSGGLRYYVMDNEPSIWHGTHRDVHPTGATMDEIVNKITDYGSMVKSIDPSALVVGPEEWGWSAIFYSGYDQQYGSAHGWSYLPDRSSHNNANYMTYLLDQLCKRSTASGVRLLDVFTLHYYPQGGEYSSDTSTSMQLLRNQSTRSLWDPNYVDKSWISTQVNLIPRLRRWTGLTFPGTQIGITEYNWGAEGHINGATAQADIWGIFGREGLDMATRWTYPSSNTPTYLAMKLYRNYDGKMSTFGDMSVSCQVPNPDQLAAFAAQRTTDGALTIMVINKVLSGSTPVKINLAGFTGAAAQVWQLTSANAINRLADVSLSGGALSSTVPPQSITLFVLPTGSASAPVVTVPSAPAGLTATAGNAQATLSWTASAGATSYNVYRGTTASGEGSTPYRTGVTATTFTDTGLTNGAAYYYQVTAANAAGASARTAEVSATPMPALPGVPTGLKATAADARVDLAWTAVSGATSYNLYRSTTASGEGAAPYRSGVTGTSYTDAGLTNGVTYYYQLTAVNVTGQGAKSSEVSAKPAPAAPAAPSTPTGFSAIGGNAQIALSWAATTGATSYTLYRGTTAGGEGATAYRSALNGTTFTDTGLTNGTTYYYQLVAVNAGGSSPKSAEVNGKPAAPVAAPAPAAPSNLRGGLTTGAAKLLWTQSTSAGVTQNRIYRGTSLNGPFTLVATIPAATAYADSAAPKYTVYYYKVSAVNSAGAESTPSGAAVALAM